jgi:hypothetical protein
MDMIPILATLVSMVIVLAVLELIRRNRLKEKYSLLWLFSSLVLLWFSFSRKSLHFVAGYIGIQYPPSVFFLIGFLFLIIINIHFSTVISRLSDRNKTLAQEMALLKEMMERTKSIEK